VIVRFSAIVVTLPRLGGDKLGFSLEVHVAAP